AGDKRRPDRHPRRGVARSPPGEGLPGYGCVGRISPLERHIRRMGHEGPAFALIERSEQEADALVRRIRPAHDAPAATAQARLGVAPPPPPAARRAPRTV